MTAEMSESFLLKSTVYNRCEMTAEMSESTDDDC